MKVLVIGATGTIGAAVAHALAARHEVMRASRNGAVPVDVGDTASLDALFASVNDIDAVVCCAASVPLVPFGSQSDADFAASLQGKLLGQIGIVRRALHHVRDGGSITLTSGKFVAPIPGSSAGALANAGLEAFVRHVAIEMPRGLRINVVGPGWVRETLVKLGMDPTVGTPVRDVANACVSAVEGSMQGEILVPARA
ncbi:MAG TPA: short chain dehydrogenase [Dongiaceae bacterium]|jgi:NAD(P)-dependent dehydrogenase (short-subunit alcohol dehydrogenase family)|nr:short chain dehydrogenase [Dongiaceae bacterium]